jgi:superoxide dismutase, Cu-Zn family
MEASVVLTSRSVITFVAVTLLLCLGVPTDVSAQGASGSVTKAVAVLHPTKGSETRGIVRYEKTAGGVRVTADVEGLTTGKHGFHVHEFGDCSAPDAASAGGHFNPTSMPHGGPSSDKRHSGDLGNLAANQEGKAHYEWVDPMLDFEGERSIVGRGVVVHAKEDDLTSQPAGDSGARIACGVVGLAAK